VGVAIVLALRFWAAEMDSHNDSRHVAEQLVALPGNVPSEVIFVDAAPYRGVAFYLGSEVEQVSLSAHLAEGLGIETVQEEMHNGEPDRIWLVPIALADQFQSIAMADKSWKIRSVGEISTDQPHVAFIVENSHESGANSK
jgi:hypothetical protein